MVEGFLGCRVRHFQCFQLLLKHFLFQHGGSAVGKGQFLPQFFQLLLQNGFCGGHFCILTLIFRKGRFFRSAFFFLRRQQLLKLRSATCGGTGGFQRFGQVLQLVLIAFQRGDCGCFHILQRHFSNQTAGLLLQRCLRSRHLSPPAGRFRTGSLHLLAGLQHRALCLLDLRFRRRLL